MKTYPVNETWKWIVQVFDTASSNREIVFRSNTQIVNYFNNPFELYSFDTQNTVFIAKIEPKETFYLPLKLVYGKIYFKFFILIKLTFLFKGEEMLYIRPSDEFELSDNPLNWRSISLKDSSDNQSWLMMTCSSNPQRLHQTYLSLYCKNKNHKIRKFAIKVRGERFNVLYEETGKLDRNDSYIYIVKLVPFARMRNLLPYSLEFFYDPLSESTILKPGEEFNLSYITFGKSCKNFLFICNFIYPFLLQ